jgi:hypothetical protein
MSAEKIDLTNWPIDPANGRYLCSPEHKMPAHAHGLWAHSNTECTGECHEGCCSDYQCKDCGATWRVQYS